MKNLIGKDLELVARLIGVVHSIEVSEVVTDTVFMVNSDGTVCEELMAIMEELGADCDTVEDTLEDMRNA